MLSIEVFFFSLIFFNSCLFLCWKGQGHLAIALQLRHSGKKLKDISDVPVFTDFHPDLIIYTQTKNTVNRKTSVVEAATQPRCFICCTALHTSCSPISCVLFFNYPLHELVTPGIHTTLMAI